MKYNIFDQVPDHLEQHFPDWGTFDYRKFDIEKELEDLSEEGWRIGEDLANSIYFVFNYVNTRMPSGSWWHVYPNDGSQSVYYVVLARPDAKYKESHPAIIHIDVEGSIAIYFTELLPSDPWVIMKCFLECFYNEQGEQWPWYGCPWVSVDWRDTVEEYYEVEKLIHTCVTEKGQTAQFETWSLVLKMGCQGMLGMTVFPEYHGTPEGRAQAIIHSFLQDHGKD